MRKLIPYVTLSLLRGEAPKLSSGRWQVDWIYIDDVIDGLLRAAQAPNVEGCTIDLGSGMLVPVQTIVQQLITLAGARVEPLFGALPDRPLEQVRVADTVYAWAKLGWRAVTSLEKGLEHTVEWYRKQLKVSS
jgi:nucleoside-diphosphate-sugar epimerase